MPLRSEIQTVLVLGSGPIKVGQAAEFDYSGTQACLALKEEGVKVVLVNSNPATIMTDPIIADEVYIEPLTVASLQQIIEKEQPDGILPTLGGQTALNLVMELEKQGILQSNNVEVLGTQVKHIQQGEDRDQFRERMLQIDEPIPESKRIEKVEEAVSYAKSMGYPIIIRPAYTLGGEGGGVANNEEELIQFVRSGLQASPIRQVLIEQSMLGWKELEYEVIRDENDTCTIVCNMENLDPVGVHTGDSIVVAPSQTLTDRQYQLLRDASIKVIRALHIVGGCNIQFGLDPHSDQYNVIEVNPRVSRSSALASKATGYPIARIATKCALGYHLDEIPNPITEKTMAAFEPALDYVVVKMPRFPFDKFPEANRQLGTQMKATGEVMAIDRTFEGACNKAIRSLELNRMSVTSHHYEAMSDEELNQHLIHPNDERFFLLGEALRRGYSIEDVHAFTQVDCWFLAKIKRIVSMEKEVASLTLDTLSQDVLKKLKRVNISDAYIASCLGLSLLKFRELRKEIGVKAGYKQVDTCAGEFEAITPYFYSTWTGQDEGEEEHDGEKALVIGSGPIRIGQGIEFDYCSVHATEALKKQGIQAVVLNNNPETVSTDYSVADRLYFEPLAVEDVLEVIEKENITNVLVQFGGQTAIRLANELKEHGVGMTGTDLTTIENMEDRRAFYNMLKRLSIPTIPGDFAYSTSEMRELGHSLTFPIIVRPSYVIGGQSMHIFHRVEAFHQFVDTMTVSSDISWPMILDEYKDGKECELDAICDGTNVVIPGIFEHLERAGVHSGDSTTVFPPISLTKEEQNKMVEITQKIAVDQQVVGLMNIQFVIQNGTVYVLEVNPRASRTVPILSKVTGIPMTEWAVNVQLGAKLTSLHHSIGLLDEPPFISVKAPAFSASKLVGVDHTLGPEMKSTGEVLGLSKTFEGALSRATNQRLIKEKGTLLCSIHQRDREEASSLLQPFVKKEYAIWATNGTANSFNEYGLSVQPVEKDLQRIETALEKGDIDAVFCTPTKGRDSNQFGFKLRALATKYNVPCWTHVDELNYLFSSGHAAEGVHSLQDYHKHVTAIQS